MSYRRAKTRDDYGQKFIHNTGTRPRRNMQDIFRWYRLGPSTNIDKYRTHKTEQHEKTQYNQIPSYAHSRNPFEKLYKNNGSGEHIHLDSEPERSKGSTKNEGYKALEITKDFADAESKIETSEENAHNTDYKEQKQDQGNSELQNSQLTTDLLESNWNQDQAELKKRSNPYGYDDQLESSGGRFY